MLGFIIIQKYIFYAYVNDYIWIQIILSIHVVTCMLSLKLSTYCIMLPNFFFAYRVFFLSMMLTHVILGFWWKAHPLGLSIVQVVSFYKTNEGAWYTRVSITCAFIVIWKIFPRVMTWTLDMNHRILTHSRLTWSIFVDSILLGHPINVSHVDKSPYETKSDMGRSHGFNCKAKPLINPSSIATLIIIRVHSRLR